MAIEQQGGLLNQDALQRALTQLGYGQPGTPVRVTSTRGLIFTVQPSGDTSGATDTTNINSALTTAAVPASAGTVTSFVGIPNTVILGAGQWYINSTLIIGGFTTLDARLASITLVSGSNCLMITNVGSFPVATAGGSCGSGSNYFHFNSSPNTVTNLLESAGATHGSGNNPNYGCSVTFPCAFGSNTNAVFVANIRSLDNFYQAQFEVGHNTPSAVGSGTLSLYFRDSNITILGGVWNRGTNGSGGNNYTDHTMQFCMADGLVIDNPKCISSGGNGLYAISLAAVTSVLVRAPVFDINPGQASWGGYSTPGTSRDGVHINGPASNIRVENVYGSTGDDAVAITSSDFGNIAKYYAGDVTNCTFENIMPYLCPQTVVKVMAGPNTTVSGVRAKWISSPYGSRAFWIGDDNRNVATIGGTIDNVTFEDVNTSQLNTSYPVYPSYIVGANLGRIKLRNISINGAANSYNLIEVGLGANGSNQTTAITDLSIEGYYPQNWTGKAINFRATSTVTRFRFNDWDAPLTNYPLIANAGTISGGWCHDVLPAVNLTAQTASISSTSAYSVPLSGTYRIIVDAVTTTAGTGGTVTVSVITNNGAGNVTQTTGTAALNTLGSEVSQTFTATVAAGQNINYSTTVTGASGSPQYSLRIRIEYLG